MEHLQIVILSGKCVPNRTAATPKCFASIFVCHVERLSLSGSNLHWRVKLRELEHLPRA